LSTEITVWNQVKTTLQNAMQAGGVLEYVKKIYEGFRTNIPQGDLPCIIMELPDNSIREVVKIYPVTSEVYFTITLIGVTKVEDKNAQIVGDANWKGILDFSRDIKKALASNLDLSGNCLKFEFPQTRFDFTDWPIRRCEVDMETHLRQGYQTRE